MYLGFISVFVSDIDRAKSFFVNTLGFEVRDDEPMPGGARWVMLAPPNAQTSIVLADPAGGWSPGRAGDRTGHAFEVDDVFATHARWVEREVEFTTQPTTEFFGGWAEFKDSEGNVWGLHSPAHVEANA